MEAIKPYLILFALVFFPVLIVYALRKKKKLERQSVEEMQQRYGVDKLTLYDEKTMYYGLKSKGALQPHEQGGIFVITDELVHFKSWDYGGKTFGVQVNFDFVIPFAQLQGFRQSKNFITLTMGKGRMLGDGLLILQFIDEEGKEDELALLLKQRHKQALALLEEKTGMSLGPEVG